MRFYVYPLSGPDGTPFYIGKGQGKRMYEHESNARRGVQDELCDVIRQLQASGDSVVKTVLYTTDDEAEALAEEKRQIEDHVRRGVRLLNWNVRAPLLPRMDTKETLQLSLHLMQVASDMRSRGIDEQTIRQEVRRRAEEAGAARFRICGVGKRRRKARE
jgi:hypothetical protein